MTASFLDMKSKVWNYQLLFFSKCVIRLQVSKQMVILIPYFLICYSGQNNVSSVVSSRHILSPRHVIVKINISEESESILPLNRSVAVLHDALHAVRAGYAVSLSEGCLPGNH